MEPHGDAAAITFVHLGSKTTLIFWLLCFAFPESVGADPAPKLSESVPARPHVDCGKTHQSAVRRTLGEFLVLKGVENDCYFTLEYLGRNNLVWPVLNNLHIVDYGSIPSLQNLLIKLRNDLKRFHVVQSICNPSVIRIIDHRLVGCPRYALNKRATIRFSGLLQDLPDELGPLLGGSVNGRFRDFNPLYPEDLVTKAKINAKKAPVRMLLTEHVPLSSYSRVLWVAETLIDSTGPVTSIHYEGQVLPSSSLAFDLADGPACFSRGEIAFLHNLKGKQADRLHSAHAAIHFIDCRLKQRNPQQVRWAMLYLGQSKAKNGIPTLLQHIDYRYTATGMLEETYPAVKALRLLGKTATAPVLEEITKPNSPLRLLLLSRLLSSIEGMEKARVLLATRQAITKNPGASKRLLFALRFLPVHQR
jgi:hypothetical protein